MQLFEVEVGKIFKYRDEVFELVSFDEKCAHTKRLGTLDETGKFTIGGQSLVDNFNEYADVEVIELVSR